MVLVVRLVLLVENRGNRETSEWFRIAPELVSSEETCPVSTDSLHQFSCPVELLRQFFSHSPLQFFRDLRNVLFSYSRNICVPRRVTSCSEYASLGCLFWRLAISSFFSALPFIKGKIFKQRWRLKWPFTANFSLGVLRTWVKIVSLTKVRDRVLTSVKIIITLVFSFLQYILFSWGETWLFILQFKVQNREKYFHFDKKKQNCRLNWGLNTFPSLCFPIICVFHNFRQKTDEPKPRKKEVKVDIAVPTYFAKTKRNF